MSFIVFEHTLEFDIGNSPYLYILCDPRKVGPFAYKNIGFDFEPFYVGKGRGTRYKQYKNRLVNQRICEINEAEQTPFVIVLEYRDDAEAYNAEASFVDMIGRTNKGTGPLLNMKGGGSKGIGNVPWNKGKKGVQVAWNKGKPNPSAKGTKFYNDGVNQGMFKPGEQPDGWVLGRTNEPPKIIRSPYVMSEDRKRKISKSNRKFEYQIFKDGELIAETDNLNSFVSAEGLPQHAAANLTQACRENNKYKNYTVTRRQK